MKTPDAGITSTDIADLRANVKQVELDAEMVEQRLLQDLAASALTPTRDDSEDSIRTRARQNLSGYSKWGGASQKKGFDAALLHQLIGNILGPTIVGPSIIDDGGQGTPR